MSDTSIRSLSPSKSQRRIASIFELLKVAVFIFFASAAAPAAAQVSFTKSFIDDPVPAGGTATLRYTLTNNSIITPYAALTFTDDYDAALSGLQAVGLPSLSLCGVASILSGTSQLSLVSGALLPGQSCSFDITLSVPAGATPGPYPSTSSDLKEGLLLTVASPASDTLVVLAPPPPPAFSKSFTPSTIAIGGTSTLTFTIDNSTSSLAANALDFADNLPANVEIAATPAASSTCTGGALTATAGTTTIGYTGGSVTANGICTVSVDVTATAGGTFDNTSGDLTSTLGNSGTASASLTASAASVPPLFSKAFSPSTVALGSVSALTFTIDNGANVVGASALDFTDNLPAGVEIASPANASTTCTGGTLTATAATTVISYTAGAVGAGVNCTVDVDVVTLTVGAHNNTSGDLTSSLGNSGTASATLTGTAAALGFTMAFSPSEIPAEEISVLTVTIDNSANAVAATVIDWSTTLPSGLEVAPTPDFATTCVGGTGAAVSGLALATYSGGSVPAGSSCTLSFNVLAVTPDSYTVTSALATAFGNAGTTDAMLMVGISNAETIAETQKVIRRFMSRRADLITMEEPDLTERLGAPNRRMPIDLRASITPEGTALAFATSLSQLRGAAAELDSTYSVEAKSLRSLGYDEAAAARPEPLRFDIWTQGTYTSYRDTEGGDTEGSFGLVYLGAEWRVRPTFVLGVLGQFDATDESDDDTGIETSGTGWMVGPYVAGKLSSTGYFQFRGAYGLSNNDVSPFGTYTDSFDTTRWLVSGKIKQEFTHGAWRLTPSAGVIYFNEEQHAYTDTNGLDIPSQTIELGRFTVGPELAYRGEITSGLYFEPSLGLTGVWDFVTDNADSGAIDDGPIRARVTGGLTIGADAGARFTATGFYDGIGRGDFEAYGGKLRLSMPFGGG